MTTPMPKDGSLKESKQAFVQEFLVDLDGAKAAVRAGYAKRSAAQTAYRLLQEPMIREAINDAMQARAARVGLEADEVLMQIAHAVRLDPRNVVDQETGRPLALHELDAATAAAVSSYEYDELTGKTKVRFVSKMDAVEKAMKHMGLYERDNKQKAGAELAQLMAAIHGANPRLRVKDPSEGSDGSAS